MGQGTLTERKSQKDMIYPLLNGVREIFLISNLPFYPGGCQRIQEQFLRKVLVISISYHLGEKVPMGPNAFPFCCF